MQKQKGREKGYEEDCDIVAPFIMELAEHIIKTGKRFFSRKEIASPPCSPVLQRFHPLRFSNIETLDISPGKGLDIFNL